MPAPDNIIELYKFENAIETAVKNALIDEDITAIKTRDADVKTTPLADVRFTLTAGQRYYKVLANGTQRDAKFKGLVEVSIVTDRANNDEDHDTIVSTTRNLIYDFNDTLNPLLTYHAILDVVESGTPREIDSEKNHDVSRVSFEIDFCIRTDCWPMAA